MNISILDRLIETIADISQSVLLMYGINGGESTDFRSLSLFTLNVHAAWIGIYLAICMHNFTLFPLFPVVKVQN